MNVNKLTLMLAPCLFVAACQQQSTQPVEPSQPVAQKPQPLAKTTSKEAQPASTKTPQSDQCTALASKKEVREIEQSHETNAKLSKVTPIKPKARRAMLPQKLSAQYPAKTSYPVMVQWTANTHVVWLYPCESSNAPTHSVDVYTINTDTKVVTQLNPDVWWPRSSETFTFRNIGGTPLIVRQGDYSAGTNSLYKGIEIWAPNQPKKLLSKHLDQIETYNPEYSKYMQLKPNEHSITTQPNGYRFVEYEVIKKTKSALLTKRHQTTCVWEGAKKAFQCNTTTSRVKRTQS